MLCSADSGKHPLCRPCHDDLPWLSKLHCPVCAVSTPDGSICGQCLQHPPAFDCTRCALSYDYPLDAMILAFKYNGRLSLGPMLAELLTKAVDLTAPPDLIVPLPLHPMRLQERGFNQAMELARPLEDLAPIGLNAVTRTRATMHQADLPWKERAKNMRGAFECRADLSGKQIAIVDDVMTTGASLNELAKTLKKAGAARVECWVLARTLPRYGLKKS